MHQARRMWRLFEPLHAVTYFTPEAREHFEAGGLRGFWRGYFAGRSAPLGAVEAAPVIAAFFGFAPGMVARALPDVWSRATPEQALEARSAGAAAALGRLLGGFPAADVAEAADLLAEAVRGADTAGRVLAAANAALPVPEEPLAKLWYAATLLREHRGDGHVAALVTAGLDGAEALVWRSSLDLHRDVLQPARGWTDEEWASAAERLRARGWLTASGAATQDAADAHRDIEEITDRVAMRPWQRLGEAGTERAAELLAGLADTAYSQLPQVNPIGLPGRG